MNTAPFPITRRAALWLLLLCTAVFFGGAGDARATLLFSGVDLGDAGRTTQWAVFALSGGITVADTTTQSPGNYTINGGNIGASGGGSITLSGTAKINGDAYIKTGGVLRKSGTAGLVAPHVLVQSAANDVLMNKVVADANNAAAQANALPNYGPGNPGISETGTWNSPSTVNQNVDLGLIDTTSGSHVVLHLTDFVLTGGAEFTLEGTALTTYIINVSGQFSLLGGKVQLMGGLAAHPENVLFNVYNPIPNSPTPDVALSSGAQFNGILYATQRTVNLSGASRLDGTLIAGKVNISGASRVAKPAYTSP